MYLEIGPQYYFGCCSGYLFQRRALKVFLLKGNNCLAVSPVDQLDKLRPSSVLVKTHLQASQKHESKKFLFLFMLTS